MGDQRVDGHALVGFVEVRQRPALVQHARAVAAGHLRALDVVEQAFGQVGRGREVLEALLVLDAHRVQAEVVGDPQRRDVHLQLFADLPVGQLGGLVGAGGEGHARLLEPGTGCVGLLIRDAQHLRVQGALRQPLLVDAERVEQLVVDDRVVHAHAALVEDADDGLVPAQLLGNGGAQRALRGLGQLGQRPHVGAVVRDAAGLGPLAQALEEEVVGEVDGPGGGVLPVHLRHAGVHTEQADQTGPGAVEVGDGQDGPFVGAQAGQHVVAVLPYRFRDDQRGLGRDGLEDLQPGALAVDEAVPLVRVVRVGSPHGPAEPGEGLGDALLQRFLRGPARRVGGGAQIAAGDQVRGARRGTELRSGLGQPVGHDSSRWVRGSRARTMPRRCQV
ncbi:hypothetical protein [Streptomyces sp. NPDC055400]